MVSPAMQHSGKLMIQSSPEESYQFSPKEKEIVNYINSKTCLFHEILNPFHSLITRLSLYKIIDFLNIILIILIKM